MNLEQHPRMMAYQSLKDRVHQLTISELIVLNNEMLTNHTFSNESKVRKLIEEYLPDEPFQQALITLCNFLLDVTNQHLILKTIEPSPLEWKP